MFEKKLSGMKIAFLVTDGFEQCELTEPWKAVEQAGGQPELVSIDEGEVQGVHHDQSGDRFKVDMPIGRANVNDYDALVLPGGVFNPDALRINEMAVEFVKDFFREYKPVAAICHGPWTLIEANVVRERRMTSWPSLRTDLINAGAEWVDEPCVCDRGLVTSRKPDDLPIFCETFVEVFSKGQHIPSEVSSAMAKEVSPARS